MKRYLMVFPLVPEHVEEFKELHKNCLSMEGYNGQPAAALRSGLTENIVYVYKDLAIVYCETEGDIQENLAKMNEDPVYQYFLAKEGPMMLPAEPGMSQFVEKVFDAKQMVENGKFDQF